MQMYTWLTSEQWMAWRITIWWKRTYEGLRGARFVSLVSPSFANSPGRGVWFGVCWWVCFGFVVSCVFVFASRETFAFN